LRRSRHEEIGESLTRSYKKTIGLLKIDHLHGFGIEYDLIIPTQYVTVIDIQFTPYDGLKPV
jgi:hypothetical protein